MWRNGSFGRRRSKGESGNLKKGGDDGKKKQRGKRSRPASFAGFGGRGSAPGRGVEEASRWQQGGEGCQVNRAGQQCVRLDDF